MPHYTHCENALEKAVVSLHPNEQKRSSGTRFARCPHLKIEIWGTRLCGWVADYVPLFPPHQQSWREPGLQ